MSAEPLYEVYLESGFADVDLEPPVETERVDFYDSGVWVSMDEERVFFPYERVQMIRELAGEVEPEPERTVGE